MPEETAITKPHNVQAVSSTSPKSPAPLQQRRRKRIFRARVASIDTRFGLSLLGEQGRKQLAEYIKIKRQHMADKTP